MSGEKVSNNKETEESFSKTIEISNVSSLVIAKSLWKNQDRLDIRIYLNTENYSGPTKKGVNLPFDKIDEIISVLQEMKQQK
jgi:hypothetical protein